MKELITKLIKADIGKVEKNVSLKKYNTYKVDGVISCVIHPLNTSSLIRSLKIIKESKIKYKIIGKGSNILFSNSGYEGVFISLNEFDDLEFISTTKFKVGSGYSLMKLSNAVAKKGLAGLEFASGIPGTVGGAIFMNAGAYKSDMGYIVTEVKVLTPDYHVITLSNKEMDFHYRTSFLQKNPDYICLEVNIKLKRGDKDAIIAVIKDRFTRRKESQPLEYPSAGSVFRNPSLEIPAGKLIDDLGLKGEMIGGAKVSEKHANFIINYNNASGQDIKKMITKIRDLVKKEYNIDLKVEQEEVK